MAPPTGPPFTPQQLPYPALYLYPLNDSFVPKHIALNHGQHVKIGRQTNAKTAPGERNGYFDSKVLSRQHAEVWEEGGKIYIKDVKSSNGTFINSERLSSEAVESDPYELKSDDIVEFGIDIVGDDNKTIIHHKVAARVACIFTEQDYQVAARAEAHQQAQAAQQAAQQASSSSSPSPSNNGGPNGVSGYGGGGTLNGAPNGFNFAGGAAGTPGLPGVPGSAGIGGARRAPMSQPTLGGMGGMGGSMRPPGKGGLTFDVILSRLQGELQKSRETGAELGTLTNVLGDVGDVLGGGLPPNLPSYPSILPPIRPSVQEPPAPPPVAPVPPPPSDASGLAELQAQLKETQDTLKAQLEKIHALESVMAEKEQSSSSSSSHLERLRDEQEEMKAEVNRLRGMVEERRLALEDEQSHRSSELATVSEEDEEEMDDDDDDARSVVTVTADSNDSDEERKERGEEAEKDRPRTPEPSVALNAASHHTSSPGTIRAKPNVHAQLHSLSEQVSGLNRLSSQMERVEAWVGGSSAFESRLASLESSQSQFSSLLELPAKFDHVSSRVSDIDTLSSKVNELDTVRDKLEGLARLAERLESVVKLTSTLEKQHEAAQSTIRGLESKVVLLEGLLKERETSSPPPAVPQTQEKETLTEKMSEWMRSVDGKWASVQSEWSAERERLRAAREEWETKVKQVDSGLQSMASLQAETRRVNASLGGHSLPNGGVYVNGDVVKHNGLVTPPSPRSQSSDSGGRYRRRRRRGRSRSSESATASSDSEDEEVLEPAASTSSSSSGLKKRGARGARDESPVREDEDLHSEAGSTSLSGSLRSKGSVINPVHAMPTPAASVADADSNPPETRRSSFGATDPSTAKDTNNHNHTNACRTIPSTDSSRPNHLHVQTAVGVLLLSVAAAAVIWKVRPDGR